MNFGVLCNGNIFQQWQLDAIRTLVSGGHNCSILIVNSNPVPGRNFFKKLIHYPYSKILIRIWFRYFLKPEAKKPVDITDLYPEIPKMHCITRQNGFSEYFSNEDVNQIKSLNLDFILRFGFGIIRGEILETSKYGVWSYHHDDDRKYRGVPTGFWEILFGDPVNAAILQRLTNKLDSGIILHKSYFATINHSWQANLNNLLQNTTEWPLQVCKRIENGETEFLSTTNSPVSPIYKMPGNAMTIHFFFKLLVNKIRFQFRDLFLAEKWNVGIIQQPVERILQPGCFEIPEPLWLNLQNQRSVYHADSFGFEDGNQFQIICEEYDFRNAKGILASMLVDMKTYQISRKVIALEKSTHLAYPYLFENERVYYCIPENADSGNIDLYRYNTSDGRLSFEKTLIDNIQAVDTTLFLYNGLWWLFFTDKISTNERLHIWYSTTLTGPFAKHENNPVKVDIRSSRPAGNPFIVNGKLFRPSQDCSIRSGRRININQVIKLTPTEFVETEYTILEPSKQSKFSAGMHTFCVTNGAIIVDGKREIFIWQAFTRKLSIKINRLFKNYK